VSATEYVLNRNIFYYFNQLRYYIKQYMEPVQIAMIFILIISVVLHEVAHGYAANWLGDPTANALGRLTLNPLKHLDPFGILAFIIMKIGWAKPVPVNPSYFKNPLKDMLWVAAAPTQPVLP